uniref:RNA polymerase III subunit Rpc25 domain-containing protein n=1 Tax=Pseudo-nitzschia arenysensis TaxID=697910 RepID=A0A7R9ZUC9_9STRA|mmetsp:Transcript_581/g.1377  ORF Transcript_581/g.1377 Transcript_581/m.1377 type:complete len:324 (+) Transcript_581:408-1379(+)
MFILTTVVDRIRVPANMLALPTLTALHNEIDRKYPNRVLVNVGLVVCRYGSCLKITNGSCVPGDGGSHHECLFRLVVFRPFVEEVCLGTIVKSTPEGIQVSLGNFFHDVFIPAYWMLRPSKYNEKLGLWVWSPDYGNEEDDDDDDDNDDDDDSNGDANVKMEDKNDDKTETSIKKEGNDQEDNANDNDNDADNNQDDDGNNDDEDGDHFEMEIGAEIRFKIKSIHFTQVTNTAKGIQATTTTTAHSQEIPKDSSDEPKTTDNIPKPRSLRKRSLSVDISDMSSLPASMNIVASICEDGLGLTSWWTSGEEEENGEEEEEGAEE